MGAKRFGTAVVLVVVGLVVLTGGTLALSAGQAGFQQTVQVDGTVENTDVSEVLGGQSAGVGGNDTTGQGATQRSYQPEVNYTYSYEGTEYHSDDVYFGAEQLFDSQAAAGDAISQFGVGDTVTVSVNADNASESYLLVKSTNPIWNYFLVFLGGFPLLIGLYVGASELLRVSG